LGHSLQIFDRLNRFHQEISIWIAHGRLAVYSL
jgi:hypothetical protein